MKASIIEVGLPTDNVPVILPDLEQCLIETGDLLIGHQIYDDQTLFVIRLLSDTLQCHLKTLSTAFHEDLLDSFQVVGCHLFKVVFDNDEDKSSLRNFPLHIGESWVAAANEEKSAYLCLNVPHLTQKQVGWLATQTSIVQWTKES